MNATASLRHWWVHSTLASMLFPASRRLWRERLHLLDDTHAQEMDEVRREREKLESEVRDWLLTDGVEGAAQKVKEARRNV